MGYSCTALAGDTLELWQDSCYKQTGMSNRYVGNDGNSYFFEIGKEREDGAIVGSVHKMTGYRVGSFKIKPNGDIEVKPYSMPKSFLPKKVKVA